jgi:hypothetical protein
LKGGLSSCHSWYSHCINLSAVLSGTELSAINRITMIRKIDLKIFQNVIYFS